MRYINLHLHYITLHYIHISAGPYAEDGAVVSGSYVEIHAPTFTGQRMLEGGCQHPKCLEFRAIIHRQTRFGWSECCYVRTDGRRINERQNVDCGAVI